MQMIEKILRASIKTKLMLSVLGISLICIFITVTISYNSSKASLQDMAFNQLEAMSGISTSRVTDHFNRSKTFTKLLAADRLTEGLFLAYEGAFFGSGYTIGKDQELKSSSFANLDKVYGEKTSHLVNSYGLANYFLVNMNGQVVYSARPYEHGYMAGKNITNGELKTTKLASCVADAKKSGGGNVFFADYEYLPHFQNAMTFFCVSVFAEFPHLSEGINKGDFLGVLVGEIDTNKLTSFLSAREGMGETGQTYLIGHDSLLRSDFYLGKEKFNIKNSHEKNVKIENTVITDVMKTNKSQIVTMIDPLGEEVLSMVAPVTFEGNTWVLVSQKQTKEVFAPVRGLLLKVFGYSILILAGVSLLGIYFSKILLSPILKATETLSDVYSELNTDSSHLLKSAAVLNDSSKDQSVNLQTTVQAVQEISSTIEQNTSNARNSENLAQESLKTAEKGRTVIGRMKDSMEEINHGNNEILQQVDDSNKRIQEILSMIAEIESKTQMINDIVFQTKLLSFNASVEAARAGEHGKGFSVVAEEIGNLATSSGNSAREIFDLLSETINKVESIVQDTTKKIEVASRFGREKVQSGQETAEACAKVFDDIVNSFNQVSVLVSEISAASHEQNEGMSEINKAMVRLNAGTDKTTEIASESSEAAEKLESRAKLLGEVVQKINLVIHGS